MAAWYYAVRSGYKPGVYETWDDCKRQVDGFSAAEFRKFKKKQDALKFIGSASSDAALYPEDESATAGSWVRNNLLKETNHKLREKPQFTLSRKNIVSTAIPVVYTDGACSDNGGNNAAAGIGVYWGKDDPRNVSERLEGKQTSNRAEIEACCRAVEQAIHFGMRKIEVRTDSAYVVNAITKWMNKWDENGMTRSNGQEVLNLIDLMRLRRLAERLEVTWKLVRGHSGNEGNEEADKLARLGTEKDAK
ncbi:unnamed protein product [Soboliphyme baturini]|uniref:ribonuclease H n=1 Tax=Soboliphyme baturini TaxID=241478 RepID=A0A183J2W1_9BILA|nr:unnamed protein product [Soboliphyme baturini]